MRTTKFLFFIYVFILSISFNKSYGQTASDGTSMFGQNTVLVYEVNFDGEKSLFIVTILEKSQDQIIFKYMFSNKTKQGTVSMIHNALEESNRLFNDFTGEDVVLEDQTSTFISRNFFRTIKNEGKAHLVIDDDMKIFITDPDDSEFFYKVSIDKKYGDVNELEGIQILNKDSGYKLVINNNEESPIILKMDIGWTIKLVAIL